MRAGEPGGGVSLPVGNPVWEHRAPAPRHDECPTSHSRCYTRIVIEGRDGSGVRRSDGKADTRRRSGSSRRGAPRPGRADAHYSFIISPVSRLGCDSAFRPQKNPARRSDRTGGRNLRIRSGLPEVPRTGHLTGDSPGVGGARETDRWTRTITSSSCRAPRTPTAHSHAPPRPARSCRREGDPRSGERGSSDHAGYRNHRILRATDPDRRALTPNPAAVTFTYSRSYPTDRARGVGRPTPLTHHREGPPR